VVSAKERQGRVEAEKLTTLYLLEKQGKQTNKGQKVPTKWLQLLLGRAR